MSPSRTTDAPALAGSIATPHYLATQAGERVFAAGGSAIDAAIAAATVLTVVYPHMCGIGGDLQALLAVPGEAPVAVNGSGAAAAAASAESLRREVGHMPVFGVHSISVPGMVSAWEAMHRCAGKLPWRALFADAIDLACLGVPVAPALGRDIAALTDRIGQDAGMLGIFFDRDGRPLAEGAPLIQPRLAVTLEAVAREGAAVFYRGDIAARLIAGLSKLGSSLTVDDLAAHETTFTPTLSCHFRGVDVLTSPPNTQGFVLLEILKALEMAQIEGEALGAEAATLARLFAITAVDRDENLADPRFVNVDLDDLLSDAHIGALLNVARDPAAPIRVQPVGRRPDGDTVAITAIDAQGHAITLIQSSFYAFGSGILEPDTGILCHNRGSAFWLDPAKPNCLVGGRRPPSTLTPALLASQGEVFAALGTMGGTSQPQILAQHLVRMLAGKAPQFCFDLPRWVVGAFGADGAQAILIEDSVPHEIRMVLEGAGLPIVVGALRDDRVGHSQIAMRSDGTLLSATDPRGDGQTTRAKEGAR
jgi:gamma-glutamyltranspeptidase/glutathione hydrolase